jgi:hypothetical protein
LKELVSYQEEERIQYIILIFTNPFCDHGLIGSESSTIIVVGSSKIILGCCLYIFLQRRQQKHTDAMQNDTEAVIDNQLSSIN